MPRPNDGTVQETKTVRFSNLNLNIYASSLLFVDVIAHGPFPGETATSKDFFRR